MTQLYIILHIMQQNIYFVSNTNRREEFVFSARQIYYAIYKEIALFFPDYVI